MEPNNKKIMKYILLIAAFSCSSFPQKEGSCLYEKTNFKLIMSIETPMINEEDHYVYVDSLTANCNDSALMMRVLSRYLLNAKHTYHIRSLNLLTDTTSFDMGETISQNWSEINRHSILDIYYDHAMQIKEFAFYDKEGQRCYLGPLWRPCR